MNNDSDQALHSHSPSSPLAAAPRRWPWFLLVAILVLGGAGGVYAWPQIAPLVPSLGHTAPGDQTAASDKDALPDLLASQQKAEDDLAALGRTVADQQQQLKTMADQLDGLASKVEALQTPAPPPAPVPPPVAPVAAAEQPPAPVAQAAPKRRKPAAHPSKPAGPISTGGAPLNAAPGGTGH
ncbi:hypothetical protein [Bradyrhizobium jicamae]|uniref:hypothetical protein n=1 Tax=Bradyrhizobium jicamae TaxID=280332 RepID=UPI001BAA4916|nr:hypothetical protein [Bradyrhizobium jicamae]MBR0937533.1 hypothetical protein [Bradyrhizobium jicamae]